MSALGDARVVTRAEVEALLALVEQVHSPNNGTIAQLCRTWLAVDAAPVVTVREEVATYGHGSFGVQYTIGNDYAGAPECAALKDKTVRLVVIDTKGGGNPPPPLGEG